MTEAVAGAYVQVVGLGLLWVSVHCAGMCGPILIGLDVAGASRGASALRGAGAILTYQAGRALTYMLLGALVGWAGLGLRAAMHQAGAWLALAFAATVLATVVLQPLLARRPRRTRLERRGLPDPWWERYARRLSALARPLTGGRALDHLALGAVMGLLPCMIPLWVLGLAATTGSPLHGAALMVLLVLMTTPTLLGVTLLPRLWAGRGGRLARVVPRLLLAVSGVWLAMVGLAGLGVVEHVHLPFELGGESYVLMLW